MEGQRYSTCRDTVTLSGFALDGTTSLSGACKKAEQFLVSCGIEDASVDAWYLLEYATGISRADFLADRDKCMNEQQRDAYAALVDRRGAHIPLQHLTGVQEFMGLPFLVNENVLIPRQDTETLVELALEKLETVAAAMTESGREPAQRNPGDGPDREPAQWDASDRQIRVLDLCTGSGCIAVSLKKLWEQNQSKASGQPLPERLTGKSGQTDGTALRITASDISEEALAVARENAGRLQADVRFIHSDLFSVFETDDSGKNRFHMIVSNPPYIRTSVIEELSEEVREHEPRLALDGGEDGLIFYRKIIRESREHLLPGGRLLLEIGYDQGEAVSELMRQNGFSEVQIAKDLSGHDRVVSGRK